MKTHFIKTINPYFQYAWEWRKPFEVRLNDRDYQYGDKVVLQEYDEMKKKYGIREIHGTINFVLYGYYAVKEDHVIFSYETTLRKDGDNIYPILESRPLDRFLKL